MLDDVIRNSNSIDCPDFDFHRLGKYLYRGLFPFLTQVILVVTIGCLFFAFDETLRLTNQFRVVQFIALIPFLTFSFASLTLLWAADLHAMMRSALAPIEAFRFAVDMRHTVGWNLPFTAINHSIGSFYFSIPLVFVIHFLGLPAFLILMRMAQIDLMVQLYKLHLERGGAPVSAPLPEIEDLD